MGKPKDDRATTRDAVFNASTIKPVPTPEWPGADGKMFVRIMPPSVLGEVTKISRDARMTGKVGSDNRDATALVAWCIMFTCDSEGRPIFRKSDSSRLMSDVAMGPQSRLATAAMSLNDYTDAAGDDAVKNSKPTRS